MSEWLILQVKKATNICTKLHNVYFYPCEEKSQGYFNTYSLFIAFKISYCYLSSMLKSRFFENYADIVSDCPVRQI